MIDEYKEMSNNELLIEKKRLENEYESTKGKIIELYGKLSSLDTKYNELEAVINSRKRF